MKFKNILIIILVSLSLQIQAQVTINSDVTPESFSIVQVEGDKSGVRLPRMTTSEMTALIPTLKADSRSIGLVVFNETVGVNRIEFFDGSDWIPLTGDISAVNGITSSGSVLELGGNMVNNTTTVDQKAFDLNFTHAASSTGEFNINSSKIKDGNIALVPGANFTVNTDAVNVTGGDITMDVEKLTVNTDAFVMENGGTTVKGTFSYPHTSLQEGYVLASDALGNAKWDGLRPFGTIVKGSLNDNKSFYYSLGEQDITTGQITLDPGRWIIFAKCTATANGNASFMYHWLKLVSYPNPNLTGGETHEVLSGINPELITGSTNTAYSCPNLVHFVDITAARTYRVKLGTSNDLSDKTTSAYGGSYFYAVRVDVAN
ncbi:MAG: hypothetical protein ACK5M3_07450 [Dysgonomonas sp.]